MPEDVRQSPLVVFHLPTLLPSEACTFSQTETPKCPVLCVCWGRSPCSHRALGNQDVRCTGPLLSGRDKITDFLSRMLGVDFVNDLMTFLLSEEAELIHLLLQQQTSPKSSGMIIPDSSLPRPLSLTPS